MTESNHMLEALGQRFGTDKRKAGNHHAYLDIYQKYFDPYLRDYAEVVAELGVYNGASLRMWLAYFEKAKIYGFDWAALPNFNDPRIVVVSGNQARRNDLDSFVRVFGHADVLIDDGGHTMDEQQISLGRLSPFVGLYIIEDLVTSYAKPNNPRCNWNRTGTQWTTLKIVQALQAGELFESEFMLPSEIAYLRKHVGQVFIERGRRSEIAFIEMAQ